jgi:hypothetical protein
MKKVVQFPKQIKWASEHPLFSFYKKALLKIKAPFSESTHEIDVTAFSINPADENILKGLLEKAILKERSWLTSKKVQSSIAMEILCHGPRTDTSVKKGTVEIDLQKCLLLKKT